MGLCAHTAGKMSESSMSVQSSASEWGADDPLVSVKGVHITVLGGYSVWPLALHWLLTAGNRRVYLERRLAHVDFTALPLEPRSAGARFLDDVRAGYEDWDNSLVTPDEADRVLAALGLLHMMVKCAIFDVGGKYEIEVRSACNSRCGERRLTVLCCVIFIRFSGGGWMRRWLSCSPVIRSRVTSMGIRCPLLGPRSVEMNMVRMRRRVQLGCMGGDTPWW